MAPCFFKVTTVPVFKYLTLLVLSRVFMQLPRPLINLVNSVYGVPSLIYSINYELPKEKKSTEMMWKIFHWNMHELQCLNSLKKNAVNKCYA